MALAEHPDQPWIPRDSFANRLVLLRRELNLSQEEAATLCGLPTPTWAAWERDGTRQPRGLVDVVGKIAAATGVDRNWLMWGSAYSACLMHEMSPDLLGDGGVHQEALFEVQMPIAS